MGTKAGTSHPFQYRISSVKALKLKIRMMTTLTETTMTTMAVTISDESQDWEIRRGSWKGGGRDAKEMRKWSFV